MDGEQTAPPAPPSQVRQTVLSVVLSAALSAVIAFAVANYTVDNTNESQRREAERTRLTAVYVPLNEALANVIACVSPRLCPRSELLRANRDFNRRSVAAGTQGSEAVSVAIHELEVPLRRLVAVRLKGDRRLQVDLASPVAVRAARLQRLIREELTR